MCIREVKGCRINTEIERRKLGSRFKYRSWYWSRRGYQNTLKMPRTSTTIDIKAFMTHCQGPGFRLWEYPSAHPPRQSTTPPNTAVCGPGCYPSLWSLFPRTPRSETAWQPAGTNKETWKDAYRTRTWTKGTTPSEWSFKAKTYRCTFRSHGSVIPFLLWRYSSIPLFYIYLFHAWPLVLSLTRCPLGSWLDLCIDLDPPFIA